jgi:thymidylate synthase (FAD)
MYSLIHPSTNIESEFDGNEILRKLEVFCRVCYKSEDRITLESSKKLIEHIIQRGHMSPLEHYSISVRFIVDRGISHELVRHRMCSFSQESTRYVNYEKRGLIFIIPCWFELQPCSVNNNNLQFCNTTYSVNIEDTINDEALQQFLYALNYSSSAYYDLMSKHNLSPEKARVVLPNALKTELIMTANLREWLHVFELRTHRAAHPQMRQVMVPLLKEFQSKIPIIFDSIKV